MKITVTNPRPNFYNYKASVPHQVLICLLNKLKDGEYEENGSKVFCKDYIGDAIVYEELGFGVAGTDSRLPLDKSRFCFSFTTYNREATDLLIKQSKLLNKLEVESGIPETKFYIASDTYVVIDADPFWLKSPLLASTIVQIVRSLVYKTNRRNIYTHIKECVKNYTTAKDFTYWKNIIESNVDFKFMFNNIDLILNGNPFTACNDVKIKKDLNDKARTTDGHLLYREVRSSVEVKMLDGTVFNLDYNRTFNHACHGISNFCYNLKYIQDLTNLKSLNGSTIKHNFISWAYNYWLLKNKKA